MDNDNKKKVDGIKKLSKEELAKSRRIVLESIGESEKISLISSKDEMKKIDSLTSRRFKEDKTKKISKPEIQTVGKKHLPEEKSSIDLTKRSMPAPKVIQDRIVKKKSEVKTTPPTEQRTKEQVLKKQQEKIKQEHLARQRIAKKKLKREQRKKKINEFKIKALNFLVKLFSSLSYFRRKLFSIVLILLIMFILFYSIFIILILKLDLETNLTRMISKYFPIPALFTKVGIIEYYVYKDFKNSMSKNYTNQDELALAVKKSIAERIILKDLIERYNLEINDFTILDQETKKQISNKIIYDSKINQVAMNRISKIKQMLHSNESFVQTANKYGDGQGQVNIYEDNEDLYSYSQEVKDLAVNEISDIIITPEGYYIFRCYDRTDKFIALSYVFIKSKGLDDYIKEAAMNLKMWSLVN
jgi:hypothetical protein